MNGTMPLNTEKQISQQFLAHATGLVAQPGAPGLLSPPSTQLPQQTQNVAITRPTIIRHHTYVRDEDLFILKVIETGCLPGAMLNSPTFQGIRC